MTADTVWFGHAELTLDDWYIIGDAKRCYYSELVERVAYADPAVTPAAPRRANYWLDGGTILRAALQESFARRDQ